MEIIRQQAWTEDQLRAAGFRRYERVKEIVMARQLPASEAPMVIETAHGDHLIAKAGYMIIYATGSRIHSRLSEYSHWPVEPSIFKKTYKPWLDDWRPSPAQQHLRNHGCLPYYKAVGVWAKSLEQDAYLQSLEHQEPILVQKGQFIAIGVNGEPYSMGERSFSSRYQLRLHPSEIEEQPMRRVIHRLLNFFKSG